MKNAAPSLPEIEPPQEAAQDAPQRVTPMMEQFIEIKAANPDCLLFYRMGDFYELFFEDAEKASRALGIVLTKRGKHQGLDIPMCGVPVERSEEYLHRLIAKGFRVAVCEQTEDPAEAKKRGAKSVVRRGVVRLVTPGTLTEDTLLDARRNNWLMAISRAKSSDEETSFGLAWLDISTGEFRVAETDQTRLSAEIARIEPGEILLSDTLYYDPELKAYWRSLSNVTPMAKELFEGATAERRLASFFNVATSNSFGAFTRLELSAAAAAATYIERTQLNSRPALSPPAREHASGVMQIDAATRNNLELLRTMGGDTRGSLLSVIDRTMTAAGARLLARRLASPLRGAAEIGGRLDGVEYFFEHWTLRAEIRKALGGAPDLSRSLARIALSRGGPRDLAAIGQALSAAFALSTVLKNSDSVPAEIALAAEAMGAPDRGLRDAIAKALADELPLSKRDGGFVRKGYHEDLDAARNLRDEARGVIAGLQQSYADETQIKSLKVKYNNVLGFFIEVPSQHGEKLLSSKARERFIHRQSMAGAMRFSTAELGELESKIASAGERAIKIELGIFDELSARVMASASLLEMVANALAEIDVACALAERAAESNWVRPEVDESLSFEIEGGRHPVVEAAIVIDGGPFVPNDCSLSPPSGADAGAIWLVTGPNMAGKSTFLRQNAILAVLAQAGSYVPAKRAKIGIVDRLFSRVGAADDLARGRSTFMVEMVETAAILHQATERSLVILDEIGRGTATFDGLSIAWATLEHLHEVNKCRGLFATHFHELTALASKLPRQVNATVRVKEWQNEVIFLHEVTRGTADRSYGIQVAKLAGLPHSVIERARVVLAELESEQRSKPLSGFEDLPLFQQLKAPRSPMQDSETKSDPLGAALDALHPDEMSPKEAMEALYKLKNILRER
ncbi:MAG: DNA mismatch repair protein MutS [Xanthobacteraceae bacterium]|nr:DNA mismatch repair protein MutS [Xanthobacteraceae bacterium]MCW5677524.1 DNA mismatch repair protein MutS [Xanthobacteraceae bacterium]